MWQIIKVFLTLVSLFTLSSAIDFDDVQKISLKKDEVTKILVRYEGYERIFSFRWTLYKNKGLVVFHSYDRVVAQNMLYLQSRSAIFKQELKTHGADYYLGPYFLVKFSKFDFEKHKAIFEIFLSDPRDVVKIQYLKNSKK